MTEVRIVIIKQEVERKNFSYCMAIFLGMMYNIKGY